MKINILILSLFFIVSTSAYSQCHYIPSTSTSLDTVAFSFSGGSFSSFGCAPIDPTFWLSGNGISVTATFVSPQDEPSFRVWGMNDDDSATVMVNGINYSLNAGSASYGNKVVCGISPGPDGVVFANGKLVGANSNSLGNYSYQDITLNSTNVNTITVTSISGAGWGFAGISVNCPLGIEVADNTKGLFEVYPNPFKTSTVVNLPDLINYAELKLYNSIGRLVFSTSYENTQTIQLNRESLPAAVYFLQISDGKTILHHRKIIVVD